MLAPMDNVAGNLVTYLDGAEQALDRPGHCFIGLDSDDLDHAHILWIRSESVNF